MLHHKNPQTFVWGFFVSGGTGLEKHVPKRSEGNQSPSGALIRARFLDP